mgnify:CR=1 FL=1
MDQAKLLDLILPSVAKPGRYTGNEWNIIRKDWDSTLVRFALAFIFIGIKISTFHSLSASIGIGS